MVHVTSEWVLILPLQCLPQWTMCPCDSQALLGPLAAGRHSWHCLCVCLPSALALWMWKHVLPGDRWGHLGERFLSYRENWMRGEEWLTVKRGRRIRARMEGFLASWSTWFCSTMGKTPSFTRTLHGIPWTDQDLPALILELWYRVWKCMKCHSWVPAAQTPKSDSLGSYSSSTFLAG